MPSYRCLECKGKTTREVVHEETWNDRRPWGSPCIPEDLRQVGCNMRANEIC